MIKGFDKIFFYQYVYFQSIYTIEFETFNFFIHKNHFPKTNTFSNLPLISMVAEECCFFKRPIRADRKTKLINYVILFKFSEQ